MNERGKKKKRQCKGSISAPSTSRLMRPSPSGFHHQLSWKTKTPSFSDFFFFYLAKCDIMNMPLVVCPGCLLLASCNPRLLLLGSNMERPRCFASCVEQQPKYRCIISTVLATNLKNGTCILAQCCYEESSIPARLSKSHKVEGTRAFLVYNGSTLNPEQLV